MRMIPEDSKSNTWPFFWVWHHFSHGAFGKGPYDRASLRRTTWNRIKHQHWANRVHRAFLKPQCAEQNRELAPISQTHIALFFFSFKLDETFIFQLTSGHSYLKTKQEHKQNSMCAPMPALSDAPGSPELGCVSHSCPSLSLYIYSQGHIPHKPWGPWNKFHLRTIYQVLLGCNSSTGLVGLGQSLKAVKSPSSCL